MTRFVDMQRMVQAALASGRLGQLVAVRWLDYVAEEPAVDQSKSQSRPAKTAAQTAAALTTMARWLSAEDAPLAPPVRMYALRDRAGGTHALVQTATGATLLAAVGVSRPGARFELLLIGTQGVAAWTGAETPLRDPPADANRHWAEALRTALEDSPAPVSATPPPTAETDAWLQRVAPAEEWSAAVPLGPPPWGVLLIGGMNTHQEAYAAALAADRRVRLIGVSDAADVSPRRRALNQQLADRWNIPYFDDLHAALRRADVRIVSLCAEPDRRAPLIVQALAAGRHLYLDKPLAAGPADLALLRQGLKQADDSAHQARRRSVHTHMFSLVPGEPAQRIRAWAASQPAGRVSAVHTVLLFAKGHTGGAELGSPRSEPWPVHTFETVETKREFANVGIYPLALLQGLGQGAVRRVAGATGNFFFAEHQRDGVEDFGAALVEFANGMVASICAGRAGWKSHAAGGYQHTTLIGSEQVVTVDPFAPRLEVWSSQPAWSPPPRHPDDPMGFWTGTQQASGARPKQDWWAPTDLAGADAALFLDCLEHGRESAVAGPIAAEAQAALLAVYESAHRGRWIVPVASS